MMNETHLIYLQIILELSLIAMSIPSTIALSQKIRIYKDFEKGV